MIKAKSQLEHELRKWDGSPYMEKSPDTLIDIILKEIEDIIYTKGGKINWLGILLHLGYLIGKFLILKKARARQKVLQNSQ